MSFSMITNQDEGDFTIALAAGDATDEMEITITGRAAGVQNIEFWLSEDANGAGLTGDTYSGALTAQTGTILTALTAKKHIIAQTDVNGVCVLSLVDSANPADQYACVRAASGQAIVSDVSGTNWEGA